MPFALLSFARACAAVLAAVVVLDVVDQLVHLPRRFRDERRAPDFTHAANLQYREHENP